MVSLCSVTAHTHTRTLPLKAPLCLYHVLVLSGHSVFFPFFMFCCISVSLKTSHLISDFSHSSAFCYFILFLFNKYKLTLVLNSLLDGRLILLPYFHPVAVSLVCQCSRCGNDVFFVQSVLGFLSHWFHSHTKYVTQKQKQNT